MLKPGDILQGRYHILQFIAQNMVNVYLAADNRFGGKHVSITEMDPSGVLPTDQGWAITAFQQEARMLAGLNHPTIARVMDFFQENQLWYLVMEYVRGETLDVALKRHPGGFSEERVMFWASQLGSVSEYLHQQNPPIIFRDLKPGKVMVRPGGMLKLPELGLAHFFIPMQRQETVQLGTAGYAAPEQLRAAANVCTDVYSLGVVLHQLLTGYDPASTPMNLPPVMQLRPGVSPRVSNAIGQALQIDPSQRFQSIQAFASALGVSISGSLMP